mmetsp:Transcript_70803/g.140325  ORF Transcript_70803/g.140325 Transcript_70803/m.140325 type:complete len:236 (+) Transcript_70803:370-1077(+)
MHRGELDARLCAHVGSHHHVRRIERVNVIRREGSRLLAAVGLGVVVVKLSRLSHRCIDALDVALGGLEVRLNDRKAERSRPLQRLATMRDSGAGSGFHPLHRVDHPLGDALQGGEGVLREIHSHASKLLAALVLKLWQCLELPQDLIASANERDTIDRGHHNLLDNLAADERAENRRHLHLLWRLCRLGVLLHLVAHDVAHDHVHVLRLACRAEVDLLATSLVAHESRVVLHPIA